MKVANDVVKSIQAKELNLCQFQNFLTTDWEADHGDVIYYWDVRWLSLHFELCEAFKVMLTLHLALKLEVTLGASTAKCENSFLAGNQ